MRRNSEENRRHSGLVIVLIPDYLRSIAANFCKSAAGINEAEYKFSGAVSTLSRVERFHSLFAHVTFARLWGLLILVGMKISVLPGKYDRNTGTT